MKSESNGVSAFKVIPVETVKVDLRRFHQEQMKKERVPIFWQRFARLRRVCGKIPTISASPNTDCPRFILLSFKASSRRSSLPSGYMKIVHS